MRFTEPAPIRDSLYVDKEQRSMSQTWILWFLRIRDFLLNPTFTTAVIGTDTSHSSFEADGTLVATGNATGWRDIHFPQSPPKTTGAGTPSLVTWLGNLQGFAYGVNDAHTFDPQEYDHAGKVGATATWHVHFVCQSVTVGDKYQWSLEYTQTSFNTTFPATTTLTAEYTVTGGTVPLHIMLNIGTMTTLGPGSFAVPRIKRIAKSAGGTDPASPPVVLGVQYHYELDTPAGSRQITSK